MSWIALVFALIGAYLVTQESRKARLVAFCIWTCTNAYWTFYNFFGHDWALGIQFAAFFILALLGIRNNWKDIPKNISKI